MTPEEYIKAYTRGCSNELVHGGYHEWLTPENALAAVELAREEMKKNAIEGYIVRTKIGELKFFSVIPARYEDEDLGIADWLVFGACISCSFGFSKLFPTLLWENKPLKVKLTINK